MLKLEKVTGGYANIPVLKDVTFEVADGELVGLIGLNLSLIHILYKFILLVYNKRKEENEVC